VQDHSEQDATPTFACLVEQHADEVVVSVHGELDLASASTLRHRLLDLFGLPVTSVTLDLSGLSFMDSTGLSVLVGAERLAAERGIALEVEGASTQVAWMLSLTGLAPLAAPVG
jgi:anti-sigma B factor antagonist